MLYDLLIKGGHVFDPAQGVDAVLDIGITGRTITQIAPDLSAADATRTIEVSGTDRYVVPGLIDIHTHIAYGAITRGVGMEGCDPDVIGVGSGVTTLLDCGSVGVANIGVFPAYIIPRSKTRIVCYLNVGSFAHTTPGLADMRSLDELDADAIGACIEAYPGLVKGLKLRLVGDVATNDGEELIRRSKSIASEHRIPMMTHIGNLANDNVAYHERMAELTRLLLRSLDPGDILTHLCTPFPGGVLDGGDKTMPVLREARENGVVLDPAIGRGNFAYEVARELSRQGMHPDTISTDLTAAGQSLHSLMECMSKFMAIGYTLADVVRMTTGNAAKAIGMQDEIGTLQVGREADITIMDVTTGSYRFLDSIQHDFTGSSAITPVHTVRAGELIAPVWGTHPWGWLPETASAGRAG